MDEPLRELLNMNAPNRVELREEWLTDDDLI